MGDDLDTLTNLCLVHAQLSSVPSPGDLSDTLTWCRNTTDEKNYYKSEEGERII